MKKYFNIVVLIACVAINALHAGQAPKRGQKQIPSKPVARQAAKPAAKPVSKKSDQELLREQVEWLNKTKDKKLIEIFNEDKRLKDFCLKNLIPVRNWTEQDQEDTKKWARRACDLIISNSVPGEIYSNFISVRWALRHILDDALIHSIGDKNYSNQSYFYSVYKHYPEEYIPNEEDFFNRKEIVKSPRKANFISKKSDQELLRQQIARISQYKWLDQNKAVKDFCYKNLCPIGNWTKQDQINTDKWIKKVESLIGNKHFGYRSDDTDDEFIGQLVAAAFMDSPYYLSLTDKAKWISDVYRYGRYIVLNSDVDNRISFINTYGYYED